MVSGPYSRLIDQRCPLAELIVLSLEFATWSLLLLMAFAATQAPFPLR